MDIHELLARLPFETVALPPLVTVIRLTGVIGISRPLSRGLSLAGLAGTIERAFKPRHLSAVALVINSPGGSPVQSSLIAGRIRQLAEEKSVPVLAFVEDVAASGGYWLATAADEIFVDEASIVGSIGVVSGSFGFHEMITKMGVERRLHTQGAHKAMLDPFRPEQPEDVARLKSLQAELHETFKAIVRRRRDGKLKAAEDQLFEGDVWTGRRAVEIGLADQIGDLRSVLRSRFGANVKTAVVGGGQSWLRRRFNLTAGGFAVEAIEAIEERLAWSRYGL